MYKQNLLIAVTSFQIWLWKLKFSIFVCWFVWLYVCTSRFTNFATGKWSNHDSKNCSEIRTVTWSVIWLWKLQFTMLIFFTPLYYTFVYIQNNVRYHLNISPRLFIFGSVFCPNEVPEMHLVPFPDLLCALAPKKFSGTVHLRVFVESAQNCPDLHYVVLWWCLCLMFPLETNFSIKIKVNNT